MANRELLVTLGLNATTYTTNIRRAKALTKELDSEFKLVSSSSENFENNVEGLGKKINYLGDKIKVASAQSDLYTNRLKESTDELNKAKANAVEYADKIKAIQTAQKGLTKGTDEYKAQAEELKKVKQLYDRAEKDIVTYNQRILDSRNNYALVQTEVQKYNKELATTNEKMKTLKTDKLFDEMNKDLEKSETSFKQLKSSVDGFDKTFKGLETTQKHYNSQIEKSKNILNEYNKDMDKSKSTIKEYEGEVNKLGNELKELENKMKGVKENDANYKELRNEVEQVRQSFSDANAVLEFHRNRLKEVGNSYTNAKQKMSTMEGEVVKVSTAMKRMSTTTSMKKLEDDIEDVNRKLSALDNQFSETSTRMGNFERTTKGLAVTKEHLRQKILLLDNAMEKYNTSITAQKSKIVDLENQQKDLNMTLQRATLELKQLGNATDDPNYQRLTAEILATESRLNGLDTEIRQHRNQLDGLDNDLTQTTVQYNNLSRALITADANFVCSNLERFGSRMQSLGGSISSVGGALAPVSMAVSAMGGAMLKTGIDFQSQMAKVGSLTGETGAKLDNTMARLTESARKYGAETRYSATEAGQGLEYLMLAGYGVEDSITALDTVIQTSMAGTIDMKTSSDLLTDSLGSLGDNSQLTGDKIKDLDIYANQLAVTSTGANATIEELMRSFITVGGQVDNMNIPLSTANTLLGILADQGFKAEQAGNSLNSILINMTQKTGQSAKAMAELGVSAFDADGNIKPIEQTLYEVKKALEDLDDEQAEIQLQNMLGGKVQAKTLQKLLNGISDDTADFTDKYKGLREEIEKGVSTDALKNMGETVNDTLQGDLFTLKSRIEDLFIDIFTYIEPKLRIFVKDLTQFIVDLTEKWKGLNDEGKDSVLKWARFLAIISPLLLALGATITAIGSFALGMSVLLGLFRGGGRDITSTTDTIARSTNKFTRLIATMDKLNGKLGRILPAIAGTLRGVGTRIGSMITTTIAPAIVGMLQGLAPVIAGALSTIGGWIVTGLSSIATFLSGAWIWIAVAVAIGAMVVLVVKNWETIKTKTIEIWNGTCEYLTDIWEKITTKSSEIWSNLKESVSTAMDNVKKTVQEKWDGVTQFFQKSASKFKEVGTKIKNGFVEGFNGFIEFAKGIPSMIGTFIYGLGVAVVGSVIGLLVTAVANVVLVFKGIMGVFKGVGEVLKGIFTGDFENIKEGIGTIMTSIEETISKVFNNIVESAVGVIDNFTQLFGFSFRAIYNTIVEWVTGVQLKFVEWKMGILLNLSELWTGFLGWCSNMLSGITSWATAFVDAVVFKLDYWKNCIVGAFLYVKDNFWIWVDEFLLAVGLWLTNMVLVTITKLQEWKTVIVDTFLYVKDNFWIWVDEFINKVSQWLATTVANTIIKLGEWRVNIINTFIYIKANFWTWVSEFITKVIQWGSQMVSNTKTAMSNFAKGIKEKFDQTLRDLGIWMSNFIRDLSTLPAKLYDIGKKMVDKLWKGFSQGLAKFKTDVKNAVNNVIGNITFGSFASKIDVASPEMPKMTTGAYDMVQNVAVNPIMSKKNTVAGMFDGMFDMADFKTDGGFYERQPVAVSVEQQQNQTNEKLIKTLLQQNQMLMQMMNNKQPVQVAVQVDGKEIAKASAKYMDTEINTIKNRKSRLGGISYGL